MYRIFLAIIVLSTLAFASGCATTRQFVSLPNQNLAVENPQQCRIYVFRPEALTGGIAKMKIMDEKRLIGDLGMKSFLCWERDPGKVTVYMDFYSADNMIINMREDLDTEPGGVYYLRAGLLNPFNPAQLDTLTRLSDEEGRNFLKECNPPQGNSLGH